MPTPSIAIGVMAHNEGRNVGRLLDRLRSVDLPEAAVRIIVVASGCTDDTVAIVQRAAASDPRVTVVVDPERRGKAAAINQFIGAAGDAELLVMESADTLPEPGTIAALVARFADPGVGMVGAHPMPEDDEATFIGFANQLLWRLHHAVASRSPKQGELVAWRNVIESLPPDSVMDEACLEQLIVQRGYALAYAPEAIVRNRGAATVGAFVLQRRRNHAGHRALAAEKGYRPATRDHLLVLRLALAELARHPARAPWFAATAMLEVWASLLGWWDHAVAHRSHALWTMIEGTKGLARTTLETYPQVGILSVSYEHPENVLECLASVKRDAYPAKHILVIDNGHAGAATLVREAHPDVEVLRLENRGLANAVNAGMRMLLARGCDFVLLLNDDVVIARDFIEQAVAAAAVDPRAASVTGPIYYYYDPERLWYAGGEILWWLGKTYHRGRRVQWGPAFRTDRRVGYGGGAATLYPAEALRAIGEWDERYFLVFEECDWSVRASRAGWHHLYTAGPKSWHKVSASFGGEKAPTYLYFLFRNNLRFMRKHARPWHWPTFLAFFVLESLVRYSLTALAARDRWRRERAIWLAVADGLRGRYGRGSWLPAEATIAERRAEASSGGDRDVRRPAVRVARVARNLRELAGRAAFQALGPRRFHRLIGALRARRSGRVAPADLRSIADVADRFHVLSYTEGALDDTFWFGLPIQKSPLDCWVYQEILFELRPDLIVETGTYLGGSALFFAHLCELLGHGEVVTIDRQRRGTVDHPRVTQLVGDALSSEVLDVVIERAAKARRVLVVLDDDHSAPHVLRELAAYGPLVTPGSYLVVEDTNVNGHPVMPGHGPGPHEAVEKYLETNDDFVVDRSREKFLLTYFPDGWLRKRTR